MKKLIFVSISIIVLILSSCSKEEEILQIGFVGTLTGAYASVGISEMYGAEMAVNEINLNGGINGKQVQLVIKDDEANPEIAVQVDNELKEMGINIIIGHSLSIVAEAALANAEINDILLVSPSIGSDAFTGLDDNLIRNVATTYYEGRAVTKSLLLMNPNKVLFLYNLDNYILTQYHKQAFEEIIIENGYQEDEYKTYGFASNNAVQKQEIEDLLATGEYDSVFMAGSNIDSAPFINFIKTSNMDIDIYLSSWAATGIIELIDTVNTSNIFAYFDFIEEDTVKFTNFKTTFEDTYDIQVDMLSVNAYDIVYLLKEAIENGDSTDIESVKKEILEIDLFDGIAGDYTINEYGDTIRTSFAFVIEEGKWKIFVE